MIKERYSLLFSLILLILSYDVMANQPEVCFYVDDHYSGEHFCVTEGNSVNNLTLLWNDKISSISIPHGMVVTVYEDVNFSGNSLILKNNADLFSSSEWQILNDQISSFKVSSAACFYEYDEFSGDSICLSGGERIDLYQSRDDIKRLYRILNPLNDGINSITIPSDMQVIVYKDDDYNGEKLVLTENYYFLDLKNIDMDRKISSIITYQGDDFLCDQLCAIRKMMTIPIKHSFGDYWLNENIGSKQVLISFKLTDNDDYFIDVIDSGMIRVKDRKVYFVHDDINSPAFFEVNKKSNRVAVLSRFIGGYFEMQFIESIGTQAVYFSPLISYLFNPFEVNIQFSLMNFNVTKNKPVIIDKIVMTVEKAHHMTENRTGRSIAGVASCWLMPILSIYNYLVQGQCNQVDRFVANADDFFNSSDDKILQISGSSKPLLKIETDKDKDFSFDDLATGLATEPNGTLTHINTDMNGNSLVIPATALACHVSMKEQLLPHLRFRRDLIPTCIDWTLNILTDFTVLFGDSIANWNSANFGRVIERILRQGDTGYAVSDVETETRLINNIREHVAGNTNSELIRVKTAFDFSQLSYANYLRNNNIESKVFSPQQTQTLPLGRYELALKNFNFIETVPRIRQQGVWVEHPEMHFDIEIITGAPAETLAARQRVISIFDQWRQQYYQKKRPLSVNSKKDVLDELNANVNVDPTAQGAVIPASRIVSDVIQSWLRTSREDYIYVIARLSGEIVSITLAVDIDETDMGIAGSLTNPAYVLNPESEGAIRGAGTAAIRALAQHAAEKGKRALVSDVISEPSAIVKQKVGFKFVDEL